MGDALERVVDHDREVVAGRHVLARQYEIAPSPGIGYDLAALAIRACAFLRPAQSTGPFHRAHHVEPDSKWLPAVEAFSPLLRRHLARSARIKRRTIGVAWPACMRLAVGNE